MRRGWVRASLSVALLALGSLVLTSLAPTSLAPTSLARAEPAQPAAEPAPPAPRAAAPVAAPCPPLADNPFDEPASRAAPVDLNHADERALLDLPGIGPARARAILDYRSAHGGFRSISQLLNIKGIGRALLKQLRPLITLS